MIYGDGRTGRVKLNYVQMTNELVALLDSLLA